MQLAEQGQAALSHVATSQPMCFCTGKNDLAAAVGHMATFQPVIFVQIRVIWLSAGGIHCHLLQHKPKRHDPDGAGAMHQ